MSSEYKCPKPQDFDQQCRTEVLALYCAAFDMVMVIHIHASSDLGLRPLGGT